AKVLQVNRVRDDLRLLRNEVESAQRAYESTTQRFNQTNLEGQSNQTDIAILNPAVAPLHSFGPRVFINTLLSVFFGTLLGMGFAMLAEMRDRRIRSSDDLAEAVRFPVLGVMDWSVSKKAKFNWQKWLMPRRLFPT
ncbi:MAG: chain length determinant protein EpsF, partial [Burkholderiaceae bacterium]